MMKNAAQKHILTFFYVMLEYSYNSISAKRKGRDTDEKSAGLPYGFGFYYRIRLM